MSAPSRQPPLILAQQRPNDSTQFIHREIPSGELPALRHESHPSVLQTFRTWCLHEPFGDRAGGVSPDAVLVVDAIYLTDGGFVSSQGVTSKTDASEGCPGEDVRHGSVDGGGFTDASVKIAPVLEELYGGIFVRTVDPPHHPSPCCTPAQTGCPQGPLGSHAPAPTTSSVNCCANLSHGTTPLPRPSLSP